MALLDFGAFIVQLVDPTSGDHLRADAPEEACAGWYSESRTSVFLCDWPGLQRIEA